MLNIQLDFIAKLQKEAEQSVYENNLRKLTKTEITRYASCHEDLQLLFDETRKELLAAQSPVLEPIDIFLVCGHRGQKEQDEALKNGFSKLRFPNSKHNKIKSLGLDFCPFVNKKLEWNEKHFKLVLNVMMRLADKLVEQKQVSHNFRFGADFNQDGVIGNDRFIDMPHVEITSKLT